MTEQHLKVSHAPARRPTGVSVTGRKRPLSPADYALAFLVGLLALVLYMRTLAPGLLGGDSGEFQFAAWLGGFAHPTGYPLYLLLGYGWTHLLRLGDPAWRMNAFSALWGGLAIGLIYLLALRVLQLTITSGPSFAVQRLAALFVALTFAVTPTFWSQAVIAEVYTLHIVFVAAVLLGLVTWAAQPSGHQNYRPLYWTAAIYGLSLAHHRSMLLLAPAIAIYLWQNRRWDEDWRMRFGGLARALPLLLLPLLLYLYIPLRAPHVPYFEIHLSPDQTIQLYRPTVLGFVKYVTGTVFSAAIRPTSGAIAQLAVAARFFIREVSWAGLALGLFGMLWLARRARSLFTLTGVSFLAIVAFNLFYGIGDIYVFYIPAYLIWVIWMGLGVAALAWQLEKSITKPTNQPANQHAAHSTPRTLPGTMLGHTTRKTVRLLPWLACLLAFALPAWTLITHYAQTDQALNNQARTTWQAIVAQPIPQDAILISNDRDEMTPLWYLQYVEGVRPDLTGLFPLIQPTAEWSDVGQVIDMARRSERPVLLIKPMPGLEIKFRLEPFLPSQSGAHPERSASGVEGAPPVERTLVQVLGPAVEKPPIKPHVVVFADAIRLNGYDVQPDLVSGNSELAVALYWQPLHGLQADYTTFVHLLNADGVVVGQNDHQPGGVYYPTSLWRPGELLKDVHTLTLAPDLGRPPYTIEVGLYTKGTNLQHLGSPEQIGVIGPARAPDQVPENLAHRLNLIFGDQIAQIALNGYEMTVQGNLLTLRLYWQALRPPTNDYTIFVHVLNADDMIVAQQDQQPAGGEMPTSTWPRGYILADDVTITLPADLPEGTYRLVAGLYNSATLVRLHVSDVDGHPLGNSAPLGDLSWPPGP